MHFFIAAYAFLSQITKKRDFSATPLLKTNLTEVKIFLCEYPSVTRRTSGGYDRIEIGTRLID